MTTPTTLLRPATAAKVLELSPRTLERARHQGWGPPYVRLSSRAVRYRPEDLAQWIAARRRTSTSDPGTSE